MLLGAGTGLAALGALNDFNNTNIQREALEAEERYKFWTTTSITLVAVGAAVAGTGFLLWPWE